MIRTKKHELLELATLMLLANTPGSLFTALSKNNTVERLRSEMGQVALAADFARLTARARRTEITLGLAYAVLVAMLTHEQRSPEFDPTRLMWGKDFVDLAQARGRSTSLITVDASGHQLTYRSEVTGTNPLRIAPDHSVVPDARRPS